VVLTTPGVADSRACSAGQRVYEMLVLIGAFEHHHVDLLVHLVVLLEQADFGDATGMEELPRGDWWIYPPLSRHTINHLFHFEMPSGFSCMCAGPEKGSCACACEGDAGATAGFQLVLEAICGYLHGTASWTAAKRGLDEDWRVAVELKNCISCHPSSSSPIQVAAITLETRRNPPVVPAAPSPSHACPYLRPCAHARKTARQTAHDACKG